MLKGLPKGDWAGLKFSLPARHPRPPLTLGKAAFPFLILLLGGGLILHIVATRVLADGRLLAWGSEVRGVVVEGNCGSKRPRRMVAFTTATGLESRACSHGFIPTTLGREVRVFYLPDDPVGTANIPGWRMWLPLFVPSVLCILVAAGLSSLIRDVRRGRMSAG